MRCCLPNKVSNQNKQPHNLIAPSGITTVIHMSVCKHQELLKYNQQYSILVPSDISSGTHMIVHSTRTTHGSNACNDLHVCTSMCQHKICLSLTSCNLTQNKCGIILGLIVLLRAILMRTILLRTEFSLDLKKPFENLTKYCIQINNLLFAENLRT